MFKRFLLLFGILCTPHLKSQIINIESLRLETSQKWSVRENFDLDIVQQKRQLINISNNLALSYHKKDRYSWLFLNNLNFTFSGETDIERSGFGHLRFTRKLHKKLEAETFVQYQVDVPLRIEQRVLMGMGVRYNPLDQEKVQLYVGTAPMYENDRELDTAVVHSDWRLSNYISLRYKNKENFSWLLVAYYQPVVDRFKDFRVSLQSQISFRIWKNLSFISTAVLNHDAFPVMDDDIPNQTYKVSNGLSYKF